MILSDIFKGLDPSALIEPFVNGDFIDACCLITASLYVFSVNLIPAGEECHILVSHDFS